MHDARGKLHYIAVDLESRTWVEAGLDRLEAYLDSWRQFGELDRPEPR